MTKRHSKRSICEFPLRSTHSNSSRETAECVRSLPIFLLIYLTIRLDLVPFRASFGTQLDSLKRNPAAIERIKCQSKVDVWIWFFSFFLSGAAIMTTTRRGEVLQLNRLRFSSSRCIVTCSDGVFVPATARVCRALFARSPFDEEGSAAFGRRSLHSHVLVLPLDDTRTNIQFHLLWIYLLMFAALSTLLRVITCYAPTAQWKLRRNERFYW